MKRRNQNNLQVNNKDPAMQRNKGRKPAAKIDDLIAVEKEMTKRHGSDFAKQNGLYTK